jgi:hypothetical protein
MSSSHDDFFAEPAYKAVATRSDAVTFDEFADPVYRAVVMTPVVHSGPNSVPELMVGHSTKAPVSVPPAVALVAPALPSAPYFLEQTHLRSTAAAADLLAGVKRALSSQSGACLDVSEKKCKVCLWHCSLAKCDVWGHFLTLPLSSCQITCRVVRNYVGVEFVAKLFFDAASREHVIECQCMQSRSKPQFLQIFVELTTALVSEGLVSKSHVSSAPTPVCVKPLALPASMDVRPDVSFDTLKPLHAMIGSSCGLVRREGLAVLASICANASPHSLSHMKEAGTLDLLKSTSSCGELDYESKTNCAAALAVLQH